MPNNMIKSFAKKTGKSEQEVERLWKKAKEIASAKIHETDEEYYPYVTNILKKMLKINESCTRYKSFKSFNQD